MNKFSILVKFKDGSSSIAKEVVMPDSSNIVYAFNSGINTKTGSMKSFKITKYFADVKDFNSELTSNELFTIWNALKSRDLNDIAELTIKFTLENGNTLTYQKTDGIYNTNYEMTSPQANSNAFYKYNITFTIWG